MTQTVRLALFMKEGHLLNVKQRCNKTKFINLFFIANNNYQYGMHGHLMQIIGYPYQQAGLTDHKKI
jgi:hypothetical protein